MPKTQTVLEVFVASPSDVVEERNILKDVVRELDIEAASKREPPHVREPPGLAGCSTNGTEEVWHRFPTGQNTA